MLPLDLLNELLTLLDDASTYRAFALSSHITSQLCRKDVEVAKKRFTMFRTAGLSMWTAKWYCLPNAIPHGPNYDQEYQSYCTYLDGRREGRYDEWFTIPSHPGETFDKYVTCTYVHGVRHGRYVQWYPNRRIKVDIAFTHGVPEVVPGGRYEEWGRGMRLVTD